MLYFPLRERKRETNVPETITDICAAIFPRPLIATMQWDRDTTLRHQIQKLIWRIYNRPSKIKPDG